MYTGGKSDRTRLLLVGWSGSTNFGSNLQAIAMYTVLNKFADCDFFIQRRYYKHLGQLCARVYANVSRKIKGCFTKRKEINVVKQRNFERCYDMMRKVKINTKCDYENVLNTYYGFVVGSDQVWNPYHLRDTFLLDFVPSDYVKLSYASSVGVRVIPKKFENKYKKYLEDFTWISVRERTGAECLEKILGRDVDVVIDPTLLIESEEWRVFAEDWTLEDILPEKYLLAYFVGHNIDYWGEVRNLARKLNLPVVILPMDDIDRNVPDTHIIENAGPKEFVHLVENATFICSDSFHMVCFALTFEREFAIFKRFADTDTAGQNSRIDDLFHLLDIERYYTEGIVERKIDYISVNSKLDELKKQCMSKLVSKIQKRREGKL